MIKSFRCKETERIAAGRLSQRIPPEIQRRAKMRLDRIDEILRGECDITVDTALRLGRYFGTSASFWMTLQDKYELELAADAIGAEVELMQRVA